MNDTSNSLNFDLVLVGGGLANGLIALRLSQVRPELRVAIVEAGAALGGNHTWSLFDADLTAEQREWTAALIAHQWEHYSVRFPRRQRVLPMGYRSSTSDKLAAALTSALPAEHIFLSAPAVSVAADRVVLADQRQLNATAVIDGRGYRPSPHLELCWQKFVGQELELAAPHGLTGPVIMDATVPQLDGYRFVYVLPLGPRRVLVEDTYFSDAADLSEAAVMARIADYAADQGWSVERIVREEAGVLPMAIGGNIERLWDDGTPGVGMTGLQAALFQPATGYSFPDAARSADLIAALPVLDSDSVYRALREHSLRNWRATGFYRYLNLLLFKGANPAERYWVLERFYGMSDGLIRRFYAGQSSLVDRARILIGKPPISVRRAVSLTLGALAGRFPRG